MPYGRRIGERDLVPHALRLLDQPECRQSGLSLRELDRLLRGIIHPTGQDLAWLEGRFDDRFSQKVRNLHCHHTLEKAGLAVFEGEGRDGRFLITDAGRTYLQGPGAHFGGGEQLQLKLR